MKVKYTFSIDCIVPDTDIIDCAFILEDTIKDTVMIDQDNKTIHIEDANYLDFTAVKSE